jgi:hypothetical protein
MRCGLQFDDKRSGASILPESRQGDLKRSILKTEGGSFSGTVEIDQLLAKGEDFRHQFKSRGKERACERKQKREESHKR